MITNEGGSPVLEKGVCWSTLRNPTMADSKLQMGNGQGSFSDTLRNLVPNTKYYIRAYAINAIDTSYGNELSFTTTPTTPTVTTFNNPIDTGPGYVTLSGEVISDGGYIVSARGICRHSTNPNPTISNTKMEVGAGTGNFSGKINLLPGSKFYYRAYATNSLGTSYGAVYSYTAPSSYPVIITTQPVSNISSTSAIAGGNLISNGGHISFSKGICYSTSPKPTLRDAYLYSSTNNSNYLITLTGLSPGTQYYLRAYWTVSSDTIYGDEITFTTSVALASASVNTNGTMVINQFSGRVSGTIVNDGGSPVFERGFCWNSSITPYITDHKSISGSGTGAFSDTLTGLLPNTTYYIRPYAINSIGISYGTQTSFTTSYGAKPSVTTNPIVSHISPSSLECGGVVTYDGGGGLHGRGICYDTSPAPTLSDETEEEGSGIGTFSSILKGLTPNTTYYIRTFASNPFGIAYGAEIIVTTLDASLPVITNAHTIEDISFNSAYAHGKIESDGGSIMISKGICWDIAPNPNILHNKINDGSYTGDVTANLEGLKPNTIYYSRLYAINNVGTVYGEEICFKTESNNPISLPTVSSTSLVSGITATSAKSGGMISLDGTVTSQNEILSFQEIVTARGVCWSTSPQPTVAQNKTNDGTGTGRFTSVISGLNPNTTYYVRAYATNAKGTAYGNEISFTTAITTGTQNAITQKNILIYPNPSNGTINLKIESLKSLNFEIRILNSTGIMVYKEKINSVLQDYQGTINIPSVQKGIYYIQIVADKEVITDKIAIE